ncbi:MAG: hypothetical protein V3T84_11145 [Phycisphaerales bacterium]
MILAVHLPPALTIPSAIGLALWILWYWKCLDDPKVDAKRRRIRRASIVVMFVSLAPFVRALSFVDHKTNPTEYFISWLLVLFALGLVVVTAIIDAVNTVRMHHEEQIDEAAKASSDLRNVVKQARRRKALKGRDT